MWLRRSGSDHSLHCEDDTVRSFALSLRHVSGLFASEHGPPVCCCSGLNWSDLQELFTIEASSLFSFSISYVLAGFLESSTMKQSW